jgi:putative acetyltransferase
VSLVVLSLARNVVVGENQNMKIRAIETHQIDDAKNVIAVVCQEIWGISKEQLGQYDTFQDVQNVQEHYFKNNGIFLVLMDGEQVVGTGAVRRLNEEVCELKRMWLLKPYRGRGFGLQMAQTLLDFAGAQHYKRMRLDLANEQKQSQAITFYKRLGFYTIERYNEGLCEIFMEKQL